MILTQEHGLDDSGKYIAGSGNEDEQLKRLSVYFQEVGGSQTRYVPRSIQADLEPAVIDKIRNSKLGGLFKPDTFIHVRAEAWLLQLIHGLIRCDLMFRLNPVQVTM